MSDVPPGPPPSDGQPARRTTLRRRRSRSDAGPPTRGRTTGERIDPVESVEQIEPVDAPPDQASSAATRATAPRRTEPRRREDARDDGSRRGDRRRPRPDGAGEGPWRELTGSGRSQVSSAAAMRARDADRPTAEDLARAEHEVVVQRRHWTPGA